MPPPVGVTFDDETNLHVRMTNDIGRPAVTAIAAQYGVDPGLVSLVDFRVSLTLTLDYANEAVSRLKEVRSFDAFDIAVEAACPLAGTADLLVSVNLPVVGNQTLYEQSFPFARDSDYWCGDRIGMHASLDEEGMISFEYSRQQSP